MKKSAIINTFILSLIFCFSEGLRASPQIEIKGVDKSIRDNIILHLKLSIPACSDDSFRVQSFIKQIPGEAIKAVEPFGYYSASFESIKSDTQSDCWSLVVNVKLGKPVLIRKKDILILGKGAHDPSFKKILNDFPLSTGDRMLDSDYESLKSNLTRLASDKGYFDATFIQSRVDIYPGKYAADIKLHFDAGDRYSIGEINIVQDPQFLDKKYIKNLMDIKKGQEFSTSNIYSLRKKMMGTGYFNQVSIESNIANRYQERVPVTIKVTPADRIKYSVGLGFSTDTGPRLSLDYKNDRISKYGYQFDTSLSLSEVISEFTTGIKIPSRKKPSSKWYNIEAGYRHENTDNLTSDTIKIGISQTTIYTNKWQNVAYLDLVYETFDTGIDNDQSLLVVPGTSFSYLKSDNPIKPNKGYKFQVDLKGTSESLLSDVTFLQMSVNYKTIHSIGERGRLLYRTLLGTTLTSDFGKIPASYRYYAGGDSSIRGFSYRSLSPISAQGDFVGGKHILVGSLEYEYSYQDNWALALFTDAGNTFDNTLKVEQSVGLGLRWFSPIGPIRFDLGVPLNNSDDEFRIHITLGPDL